ncbi:aquaporin [Camelimonas abortus]|uniref:Aquaporin n=1 Tax=Camelimonas abortus TaxID=1017184 RepID=A0ABV7LBK5_9HYPH
MGGACKYLAEAYGTALLVFFGCGAAVLSTGAGAGTAMDLLGIAFGFGVGLIVAAYSIGAISGCHINPAVTLGFVTAGRMGAAEAAGYIIAQVIGGVIGAGLLALILQGKLGGHDIGAAGLGQNGWGEGYGAGYGVVAAFLVELLISFIFVYVVLQVTKGAANAAIAGLVIGLALFVIHVVFINVTGVSVNPARSIAPAVFVGGKALAQLWLFIVAPVIGGVIAGVVSRCTPEPAA